MADAVLEDTMTQHFMRFTSVFAKAKSVLGSDEKARRWMLKRNRMLGGETPLHLLDTDIGTNAAFEELGRIEHGVFA